MPKVNLKAPQAGNLNAGLSILFGGNPPASGTSQIQQIPIHLIDSNPKQGRWSMNEDELNWLAANIAQVGVLEAVQLMQKPDGRYLLLSGHRRTEGAKRAGLQTVPAIVLPYDETRGDIIFNATNLGQRQTLRPSEKAWAYVDLEEDVSVGNKSTAAIAALTGDNVRMIQRYKRLTALLPPLLERIDAGSIPVFAGVDLSYLSIDEQEMLLTVLKAQEIKKLTGKQAAALHNASLNCEMQEDAILQILKPKPISFPTWLEPQVKAYLKDLEVDSTTVTAEWFKEHEGRCYHGAANDLYKLDCDLKGIILAHKREKVSFTWSRFVAYCRKLHSPVNAALSFAPETFKGLIPDDCDQNSAIEYIRSALKLYNSQK